MKISANILVVDDDQATLELITLSLKRVGHKPHPANNFTEVQNYIKTMLENKQGIDVIILDLMMPDRSGYDMLHYLTGILHPMPPVIIFSALSGMNDAVKALELGATKYLTKPTTQAKLLETIREVMRGNVKSRF